MSPPFALAVVLALTAAAPPARAEVMTDFVRFQATLGLGTISNDRAIVRQGPLGTEYRDPENLTRGGLSLGVTMARHWPALAAGGFLEGAFMDGGPQLYGGALGGATVDAGKLELDFLTECGFHWIPGLADDLANSSSENLTVTSASPMVQPYLGARVVGGLRAGLAGRKLLGFFASFRHDLATWGPEAFQGDRGAHRSVTFESRSWQVVAGVTLAVASAQD